MPSKPKRTTIQDGIIHTYRKAFSLNGATIITLPVQWVREHGIKAGDEFVLVANSMITLVKKPEGTKSSV